MNPSSSCSNLIDHIRRRSKFSGQYRKMTIFYSSRKSFSDFQNLRFCKFSPPIFLSTCIKPIFFRGISHIISMCSKKEMCWIYARWIISTRTIVKHAESFGDWSFYQLPRNTVRVCGNIFYGKFAITKFIASTRKQPASVRTVLIHFSPKSFWYRFKVFISPLLADATVIFRSPSLAGAGSRFATFLSKYGSSLLKIHSDKVWQAVTMCQRISPAL